jgi:phosphatidylserine/phosphatidylglycerophosphate/cardiolipin synthase-like enzyme
MLAFWMSRASSLHAKVVMAKDRVIVSSANLSTNGLGLEGHGHPVDQLAAALSGMAKYKGVEYVVLRDGSRTLRSTASRTTATSIG